MHSKISATKKRQDAEVNITSCNDISFLIPWSSNKTNAKDDTYQIRKERPVELMRYLRLSLFFWFFKNLCFVHIQK